MIRVVKRSGVPEKLTRDGKMANDKNCLDYINNPREYIANKKEFYINPAIYNHLSIKSSLRKAQFNKCCFCEKEQEDEYGAVEHYRPKKGFKSERKEKLKKPGYYWLGYEWHNLYFVCSPCNTKKGNLFPLVNENKRAKSHTMLITEEIPLLLDPGGIEDPRDHIVFDNQFPRGITDYGKRTIEICQLGRDGLNKKRRQLLDLIDDKIAIIYKRDQVPDQVVKRAKKFILSCQKPKAQFSAVARDYLKDLIEAA